MPLPLRFPWRRLPQAGLAALLLAAPLGAAAASEGAGAGTGTHAHGAPLPHATDLAAHAAAAAARKEPLVVLVTLPGCQYCETVRRHYLAPLAAEAGIAAREVDMTAVTPLRAFETSQTTPRDWARQQGVRVAPTVLFLGPDGRTLAPPLVGLQPDFYGAYLDQALAQARERLAQLPAGSRR
ncbi:thioredoxin [Cupriavidus sp. AU9028]|uniref:thioredoxin n=1 Tax=Cupriavidus sp. AU9028 TaxID=2871157 RepID=UPI001C96FC22|nr:thioredoxin [Cupriavidus sp. AU9028]MBY4896588.1 thioredoxin [Cupriavidus sp. AU9028]